VFPVNFVLMFSFLIFPDLSPDRNWRALEEFTPVREWTVQDYDSDSYRCTEVQCPAGTPEGFILIVKPGFNYLVDHVQVGHLDLNGNYIARRMNTWGAEKGVWRAFIGDFENDIQNGQVFYIRVWCVRQGQDGGFGSYFDIFSPKMK
jgi:hypothetical protein